MNYIAVLVKNQINRFEFKLCFAILFLLSIAGILIGYALNYQQDAVYVRSAADNFLMISTYASVIRRLITFLFPLLASALCAGYRNKNDELYMLLRMNRRQFVYGNALVTVGLTMTAFAAVLILNQLLCFVAFPLSASDNVWGRIDYDLIRSYQPEYLYDFWSIQNPYIYNLLFIFNIGFMSGGIGLLTYGLGYVKILRRLKPILLATLVFVLFISLFVLSEVIHIPLLSFLSYIEPGHQIGTVQYFGFMGCIYAAGMLLTVKGKKSYENI